MQYQPRARLPKHRRPFTVVVEQLEDRLVPGETLTGLLFLPGDLSPLCGGDTGQIAVVDPSAPVALAGDAATDRTQEESGSAAEAVGLAGDDDSAFLPVPVEQNNGSGGAAAILPAAPAANEIVFGSAGQALDFSNQLGALLLLSGPVSGGGAGHAVAGSGVGAGQGNQGGAAVASAAPAVASGSGSIAAPASLLSTNAEQQAAALLPSSDAGAAMAEPELHARPERHPHGGGSPAGYSPAQIRHAYGFDQLTKDGTGITIGIIDAYDDPTIQSDLNTFSTQFGLPTTGSGTFTFTQAYAQGSKPATDAGWAQEISLDVEWAHAIAPHANILLVESADNSFTNLFGAVDYAVNHGAQVVSMSWGAGDFAGEAGYDSHFNVPGVSLTASAGDSGGQVSYPSASPYVLSVGGTTLSLDSSGNRTSAETAWSSGGGGPSGNEAEPGYQVSYGIVSNGRRGTPDVSYDANPNTGFAVYDSTSYFGQSGWQVFGGTSAGAPQWAALVALADQGRATPLSTSNLTSSPEYTAATGPIYASNYHDIVSGSNGYAATTGYDLATGLGSPSANNLVPFLNTH